MFVVTGLVYLPMIVSSIFSIEIEPIDCILICNYNQLNVFPTCLIGH